MGERSRIAGTHEAAQRGLVDHIDRQLARACRLEHLLVDDVVLSRADDQFHAVQQARFESRAHVDDAALPLDVGEGRGQFAVVRDADLGAGTRQHGGFARGGFAAADNEAGLAAQVKENGKEVHFFTRRT